MMAEASLGQKSVVEALGAFLLTFIGAGSIIATQGNQLIVIALAHGIALSIAVSAAMNISGGHINPAVTIAMLATKKISAPHALVYIISQLVGAIIAGALLMVLYPAAMGNLVHWGTPGLGPDTSVAQGILFEAVLTFILVFAIFGTAVDPRHPKIGGFGIGLAIGIDIMAGGPFTGAAMNPARAIGPAIASGTFANWYVYWIGPILGAVIAALLYNYVILKNQN
ncbi:MAG: aquaporin [Thaumarchaeota archaeon]|nr:aquaporin [Nitrososphaerota archaeon]